MKVLAVTVALTGLANLTAGFRLPFFKPASVSPSLTQDSVYIAPTGPSNITFDVSHAQTTPKPEHRLDRRVSWPLAPIATDEQWCKAVSKGRQLYATFWKSDRAAGAMYNPPQLSANSPYHRGNIANQMYNVWGWHNAAQRHNDAKYDDYFGDGWMKAMRQLGIGLKPWEDVWSYHFAHGVKDLRDERGQPIPIKEQEYYALQRDWPATGARTKFGVQDKAGAIFVSLAVSPAHAYREIHGRDINRNDLPNLRSLSDLLWAGWVSGSSPMGRPGNPNIAGLKYIFMVDVINGETLSVMKRALRNKGLEKVPVWPGVDFSCADEDGAALLGTPNGKPAGYLLNQHKQEMGIQ